MAVLVDTSVVIDVLRGHAEALTVLRKARGEGRLSASEVTRMEVLAGMRPVEERATRLLLDSLTWYPVDQHIAEVAGELGRRWLPSHRGIDGADLLIAATAKVLEAELLTLNVKHFPMVPGLRPPY